MRLGEDGAGKTDFANSEPSSRSSASQDAPQKPSEELPVRRLVPPGQSAAGPPRG